MQQNFLSPKNSVIAVVALLLLLGGGYYSYSLVTTISDSGSKKAQIDQGVLNDKVKAFLAVKDKIKLNDKSFTQKEVYGQLVDYTEVIPFLSPQGRDNPFVPFVP